MKLDQSFWQEKYLSNQTPWDIGQISTPLKTFIDGLEDKQLRILIPGAGRAYEAIYLHENGFSNVFVCDWASSAFNVLRQNCENFPTDNLLIEDFFRIKGKFDLVIEQTFFCAIDPSLRASYAQKVADLLSKGGMVAGLLFSTYFDSEGPPFGGIEKEYKELFSANFNIIEMDEAPNSILPRQGNELFFKMIVK